MVNAMGGPEEGMNLDFSAEFSSVELRLIKAMKEENYASNEKLQAEFTAWVDAQQAEAARSQTPEANNRFLMKKIKLLIMAGFEEAAWDDLNDLRRLANNLKEDAWVAECDMIMDALEAKR